MRLVSARLEVRVLRHPGRGGVHVVRVQGRRHVAEPVYAGSLA